MVCLVKVLLGSCVALGCGVFGFADDLSLAFTGAFPALARNAQASASAAHGRIASSESIASSGLLE